MVTTWIDKAKRRKLDFSSDVETDQLPAPTPSQNENLDLAGALAALSHGARLCVVLAYRDGYTHEEIAELTGLPPGTVKSHISRGAARLRSLLESRQCDR